VLDAAEPEATQCSVSTADFIDEDVE
jgi:hypothetical protein